MRKLIETRFQGYQSFLEQPDHRPLDVVARLRDDYQKLHDQPIHDPGVQEARYREIEASEPRQALKEAMNEWCAVWFWLTDEGSLRHVPTPETFLAKSSEARSSLIRHIAADLKFFHWELEFPDVFTPDRTGFDALTGNPPWDVNEASSLEFFSDFDPLYRTYDKQAALRRQSELFAGVPGLVELWDEYNARFRALGNWTRNAAEPFAVSLARGKDGSTSAAAWARRRQHRKGYADPEHPFRSIGTGKQNMYKLFCEVSWNLLSPNGRLGIILPTGIYSDFGTKELRELLLFRGRIDLLYAFQNEKKIFAAADHRFKQVAVIASKGGRSESFRTRFRMGVGDSPEAHEIPDDLLRHDSMAMVFTPTDVRLNSPKSLSLVELRSALDLDIFRKIYAHSIRIGDNAPGWEITYAQEFNMTSDSKLFPPLDQWEAKGYRSDVFGQWIGPEGDVALPLYEGRMIGQFDISQKGWVEGKGRTAVWRAIQNDRKAFEPQYLISEKDYRTWPKAVLSHKIVFMDITSSTNTRTTVAVTSRGLGCGHSAPVLQLTGNDLGDTLVVCAVLNSCAFDYVTRPHVSGVHLTLFNLEECPIPKYALAKGTNSRILCETACLTFIHRRFAPEWLRLKHLYPELASKQWKHWWAVTEADRLRLRVEIDALCADLYGLDPDDFDWIVRDDPTDPKGFYRVDRKIPFQERLTGLAATAFRALKDGKWSAETASSLSNDEFLDLLGIPELTNAQAAHAKGLPGPLIGKRDGCHVWKPETFPEDDPRHGWTWDDCLNDAVALLGSEKAVHEYVKKQPNSQTTSKATVEVFELRSEPSERPKSDQQRLF